MKLLFSFALFLVVMSVEGNLRGERSHGRSLKKAKKAKPCMGSSCPPPTIPEDPDLGRDPAPTGPFTTCGVTPYQSANDVVPCFQHSDCDNYDYRVGNYACCLATRCICGTDADAGGCANFSPVFDPNQRIVDPYRGISYPAVTVPTVPEPSYDP